MIAKCHVLNILSMRRLYSVTLKIFYYTSCEDVNIYVLIKQVVFRDDKYSRLANPILRHPIILLLSHL